MSKYIKNENCPICNYRLVYEDPENEIKVMNPPEFYSGTNPAYFGAYLHYKCRVKESYNNRIFELDKLDERSVKLL